ncbi:MAG: hypothetical protein ACLP9L_36510 [Thermoguttaceae bacterium]
MENCIPNNEDRRGSGPRRIGEILAELMARYESCFPAANIIVVQAPIAMGDETASSFCRAELAGVS